MGRETKSESAIPANGIERAWRKLIANEKQYETYKKMSGEAVEKLIKEIKRGELPKEGMEFIYGYLKEIEDYKSR